ncbi:MAG: hypothetical protein ED556_11775 [Winogradskyella sp.]|uniref:tetratricopeptide repeat protein n=1 Tax=Winogradskyella sp. TaxID=1883156 RepID=UPI000F4162B9|nr:hypothetical protein [Winogradskyella sp.]RNC84132.1 MAG: hypothetical protein ED556_11775 [Winogradskyella sp.]
MKTKITLLLFTLFVGFSVVNAQQDEECLNNLSIFSSYAKNKNYDAAYEPWMLVRKKCPGFNRALYAKSTKSGGGQDVLLHKIKTTSGDEKVGHIKDLLTLYEEYNEHFSSKEPKGKMYSDVAKLSYKYRKELGLSDANLYNLFDKGYTQDLKNFKDPQALLTYFKLKVKAYESSAKGTSDTQALFDKYDDVNDKIETEVGKASKELNKLIQKEETGGALTSKEKSYKRFYEQTLNAFDKISGSLDAEVSIHATCENLIPLYQKNFDANKNDAQWLQRAMNKMGQKECTDDPMFEKLVAQKNTIEPDASTAYYLGILNEKKGDISKAEEYYAQAESLETDPLKKWKFVYGRAEKNRKKGAYGKARQLYRQALKLNPSNGAPHLRIAAMYNKSANNCGDSVFNKRAVYWLAAAEARKAGRVDSRLKKAAAQTAASYEAKAPDKSMIFTAGNSGQSIRIGCWIGASVTVP